MRVVAFKFDENQLELLDWYARKYGLNRSEVIRRAIENLLQEELGKENIPKAKVIKTHL